MRHLFGVALAAGLAIAVFFAGSWGFLKLSAGRASDGALPAAEASLLHDHAVLAGFGALLAVGLLAGILVAVPAVSPLAAGLPGLALLAWTGLYLASTRRAVQYIPLKSGAFGTGFGALLSGGVLAAAGLVMVIPLFLPSRWRRPATASSPCPSVEDTQAIAGGVTLLDDWAATTPQPRLEPGQMQPPWAPAESGPQDAPGHR